MAQLKTRMILSLVFVFLLFQLSSASGLAPQEAFFADDTNDSVWFKYLGGSSFDQQANTINSAAEIVTVGYEINREDQILIFKLTMGDVPILNDSSYFEVLLELENSNRKISIRVNYGGIGLSGSTFQTTSRYEILYQTSTTTSDSGNIEEEVIGTTIYWNISSENIDIVSVFDNPEMLLSLIRVNHEYSITGSSFFGDYGDYIADTYQQDSFDFSGGADGDDNGIWEFADPIAFYLYIGVPLFIVVNRLTSRYLLH